MQQAAASTSQNDTANQVTPGASLGKSSLSVSWGAQVVVAGVFLMVGPGKFLYSAETEMIFSQMGGRPFATLVGVMEVSAAIMLLIPRAIVYGALLAAITMLGAIGSHVFVLGIAKVDPQTGASDGGMMFIMAIILLALSLTILFLRRDRLPYVGGKAA